MILQRDPRLVAPVRESGCYFMSILFQVNRYTNLPLDTGMINDLYALFVKRFYMTDTCAIQDPEKIFRYLGLPVRYTNRHESPSRVCGPREIEILDFSYGGNNHFAAGNGGGIVTYDPWGISRTVKDGILIGKRIFLLTEAA